jgi:hypothetical protein
MYRLKLSLVPYALIALLAVLSSGMGPVVSAQARQRPLSPPAAASAARRVPTGGRSAVQCGFWNIVASPSPGSASNNLYGVVAINTNDAWAVGDYTDTEYGDELTLVEKWNGANWFVVPSPNPSPSGNELLGVAAVAANDVWAVGYTYTQSSNIYQTLIEQWNGTSWQIIPSPNVASINNQLSGVAVVAANDAWAVGYTYNQSSNIYQTLIEQWNGTSWQIVASPNAGSSDSLYGVTAVSASDVWAVGGSSSGTLTEQWNGTNWQIVASPTPGNGGSLVGVAAVPGTGDLGAVGLYLNSSNVEQTLIEQWGGVRWHAVSTPNAGMQSNHLSAITVISLSDAWAVGNYYGIGTGSFQTLTEQWNGTSWQTFPSPQIKAEFNNLYGVSALSANSIWAVGTSNTSTLIEYYC